MPIYRIHHSTTYRHGSPATTTWQALRLQPRNESAQERLTFDLAVSGVPSLSEKTDYFGNTVHWFSRHGATEELVIETLSRVRRNSTSLPDFEATVSLGAIASEAEAAIARGEFHLEQYRHASPLVPLLPEAAELAQALSDDAGDPRDQPILLWLEQLGRAFGEQFTFDATATTVSTPLQETLKKRRGVCQDFSHVMISCLRQCGIPTAYVSGYLLTTPPPGQPKLQGADAMHAWISVWTPGHGWIDYDPTNSCFVDTGHIVVARGRDYDDVSPIRGIFRGGPRHALTLGVTVEEEG